MKGEILFTKQELELYRNRGETTIFDYFWMLLNVILVKTNLSEYDVYKKGIGFYAYKELDEKYHFLWSDDDDRPGGKYND